VRLFKQNENVTRTQWMEQEASEYEEARLVLLDFEVLEYILELGLALLLG
jgi:hypothetical protein